MLSGSSEVPNAPRKQPKLTWHATWHHGGKHWQKNLYSLIFSDLLLLSLSLPLQSLSLSVFILLHSLLSLSLPPDRSSAPTPPRATSGSQQLNPAASALRRPQVLAEPREAPAGLEPPAHAAAMSASLPPPWAWAWSAVTSEGDPDPESPR